MSARPRKRMRSQKASPTVVAAEPALPNWIPLKMMTPIEAARVRAGEIYHIWGMILPRPLGDSHRLLDIDALTMVVFTLMVRIAREADHTFPAADASGHYYQFPHWHKLLPALQKCTWDHILDSKLTVTGILADSLITGDRITISPDRLQYLQPDWASSVLRAEGRAYVHQVMVELPAGTDTAKPPRKLASVRAYVSEEKLQACGNQIKEGWPASEEPPDELKLGKLLEAKLGWVNRDRIRAERRRLGWARARGRPRK